MYLVFGESIVSLFDQVLDLFHPLGESGTSHFEKRPRGGMVLLAVQLLEPTLVLLEGVEGTVDEGIDSHDKTCIDLDLLKLLSKGLIAFSTVLFAEVGETVGQQLASLVSFGLRLRWRGRAVGATVGTWDRRVRHADFVCSHGKVCCEGESCRSVVWRVESRELTTQALKRRGVATGSLARAAPACAWLNLKDKEYRA